MPARRRRSMPALRKRLHAEYQAAATLFSTRASTVCVRKYVARTHVEQNSAGSLPRTCGRRLGTLTWLSGELANSWVAGSVKRHGLSGACASRQLVEQGERHLAVRRRWLTRGSHVKA